MKTRFLFERLERLPMLRAVVPFAAGIALAEYCTLPLWFLAGAFVCTGATALLLRSPLCLIGMLTVSGFGAAQLRNAEVAVPLGVDTSYELLVTGIPSDRGGYTAADAVVRTWRNPADGRWYAAGDRIILRADSLTPLQSGDGLCCHGRIRPVGGPGSYRELMARRGFAGTLWIAERSVLCRLPQTEHTLHARAAACMRRLGVEGDAGAVVQAMTAGDRSGITPELRAVYAQSGFSHLLAVSGLHTGIVFALVNLALWWLPLFRCGHLVRNLLAAAAVWLFAAAAGFPPSAVRAAVMCTLLQTALASSSEYVALNALAAAGFGMLLWNPAWLGDISFQLSFLAVGAILAWGVPLCRRLRTRRRFADAIIGALAISLTASLATAPLVAHTFGTIPLAGILLNPAAILLATVVVFTGTLWLAFPLPWLAPLLRPVVAAAAETLGALARLTAGVPHGSVPYVLDAPATAAVYLLYALATLAAWSAEPKKSVTLRR